ncbi:RNase III domain-containing protein [Mycena indigotica]|uniref:RNase III domain-containing protein n=1 Tax=Mycena indigotica TaxID=2126181 RepID=A0A8H6SEB4_9AGAR|nr:RNase III domain-containing protein [Mycena indigotica]KAF7297368.1 RNase III domain-containing protein [Mycena indigotica]
MASPDAIPVGFSLASLMGPGWWGYALNLTMFGASLIQALNYFRAATNDRLIVKLSALAMIVMDIASSALIMSIFWDDLILHYGGLAQYLVTNKQISAECYISGFIAFLAQMYFVHQIYYVKPNGLLPKIALGAIVGLAFIGLTFSMGCATVMLLNPTAPHYSHKLEIVFGGSKGANALCDIIATFMLCKYLSNSKGSIKSTADLLDALTTIFMNRGAAVMIIQVFTFVMFFAFENPQYWLAPHMLLTKLYVNTFFAILNSRVYLREKYLGGSYTVSSFGMSTTANSGGHGTTGPEKASYAYPEPMAFAPNPNGGIAMTREVHVKGDDASSV